MQRRVDTAAGYGDDRADRGRRADPAVLESDLEFLTQLWERIMQRFQQKTAPAVIYRPGADLPHCRDLFREDFNAFLIDNEHEFEKVQEILDVISPHPKKVKLYTQPRPIFEHYGVEREVEKALDGQVWLKSGGYLIFDETEALTVVDVNTGRYTGSATWPIQF